MIQQLIVGILFMLALLFIGRMIYRQLSPRNKKTCGNCSCALQEMESKRK